MSDNKDKVITTNESGSINYANDVLAKIAQLATDEVEGVLGMSGGGLSDMLGVKNRGIKVVLEEMFGDILPIKLGNFDFFSSDGDYSWVGNFFFGLTWQLHRFIGQGDMLYWYYDHPEAMHEIMQYMVDDRLSMFRKLETEGCLVANTDNQMGGPRSYGYCDNLPKDDGNPSKLTNMWAWAESQETGVLNLPRQVHLVGYVPL